MTPNKELQVAYVLAIVLLAVGIISYSAFSAKSPEQPVRLMFKSAAGNVLFDHKTHSAESGYALSCNDCHHHPQEADLRACGDCHRPPDNGEETPQACLDCHEPDEIEGMDMIKKADAFHDQCINCHKDFGAGPEECQSCHVM
jgi:hypothetical protein